MSKNIQKLKKLIRQVILEQLITKSVSFGSVTSIQSGDTRYNVLIDTGDVSLQNKSATVSIEKTKFDVTNIKITIK